MKVAYLPRFVRKLNKLPENLQEEAIEKIALFEKNPANPLLKTHKLKGCFSGRWSFSVNYEFRIIFTYLSKTEVALLSIGNHDIYK